jgi:hypothetical protein
MPFGTGTVLTTVGKRITANRVGVIPAAGSVTPPAIGANIPQNLGMGTGATVAARTAAAGDTSLSNEVEARVVGTITQSAGSNVFQVVGTITATVDRAVDEAGLFDTSATTTSTGAISGATTLPLASGVFQATGTVYAQNNTTPANGAQTITVTAGGNTTSATVSALTGAVAAGARISQGNMYTSATFPVINLVAANPDSIQFTWQVTYA